MIDNLKKEKPALLLWRGLFFLIGLFGWRIECVITCRMPFQLSRQMVSAAASMAVALCFSSISSASAAPVAPAALQAVSQIGHVSDLIGAAYTPDGQHIIAADSRFMRSWDPKTGTVEWVLDTGQIRAEYLTFSADSNSVWMLGYKAAVECDYREGHIIRTLAMPECSHWVSTPNNKFWGAATNVGVKIFEAQNGTLVRTVPWSAQIPQGLKSSSKIAIAPDAKSIVVFGDDDAFLLSGETGALLRPLHDKEEKLVGAAFSHDGTKVGLAHIPGGLKMMDVESGRILWKSDNWSSRPSFSQNDSRVLMGCKGGLAILNVADGTLLASGKFAGFRDLRWAPNETDVLSAAGQSLYLFDHELQKEKEFRGMWERPVSARWAPDGKTFILGFSSGNGFGASSLWQTHPLGPVGNLANGGSEQGGASEVVWSADGRRVAMAGEERFFAVWDTQTRKPLYSVDGVGGIEAIALSRDGQFAAQLNEGVSELTLTRVDDGAKVWSADISALTPIGFGRDNNILWYDSGKASIMMRSSAGQALEPVRLETATLNEATKRWDISFAASAFSPDGRMLAGYSLVPEPALHIFDTDQGKLIAKVSLERAAVTDNLSSFEHASGIHFNASATRLTVRGKEKILVLDTGAKLLRTIPVPENARDVQLSPDEKWLLTADGAGTFGVLNIDSGRSTTIYAVPRYFPRREAERRQLADKGLLIPIPKWAAVRSDGAWNGAPDKELVVRWRQDGKILPPDAIPTAPTTDLLAQP